MRYTAPSGYEFEIPDDWLDEADVRVIRLTAASYPAAKVPAMLRSRRADLPLADIFTSLDNRPTFDPPGPFERHRMVPILKALREGTALWPVWVVPAEPPVNGIVYKLQDGHHRYHACVALGLKMIPVLIARDEPYEPPPSFPCGCGGNNRSCPACGGSGTVDPP